MVRTTLIRKLFRDLFQRKGALLALLVIVTIGNGSYVGMAAVFQDLDFAREQYYQEYRIGDFTVDLKTGSKMDLTKASKTSKH